MKFALILSVLTLSGCAEMNDCPSATKMLNAISAASALAQTNAEINPQSERMQKLAALAQTSLSIATTQQAAACRAPQI